MTISPRAAILAGLLAVMPQSAPSQGLDQPFDPQTLSTSELRAIQASLIFEECYSGLIDGIWGSASAAGLAGFRQGADRSGTPTYYDVGQLVHLWRGHLEQSGWRLAVLNDHYGVVVPMALLTPTIIAEGNALLQATREGSALTVEVVQSDLETAIHLHEIVTTLSSSEEELYALERGVDREFFITAAPTDLGGRAYARSDLHNGMFVTLLAISAESFNRHIAVMVSGIFSYLDERRRIPSVLVPPGGRLVEIEQFFLDNALDRLPVRVVNGLSTCGDG